MTHENLIDVLIPTYNPNPQHLTEALSSLQTQTYQNWTALIHDDCSLIDVRAIITPFLTDPRITFSRSETRLGIGGNWNASLTKTSAPLVAYLFQDDLWSPEYLDAAVKIFHENPTVGFVSLEHTYAIESGTATAPLYDAVKNFRDKNLTAGLHPGRALLKRWIESELTPNIIGEPSFVVMRRTVMQEAGSFLTDMPQFLDVEYWTRLLLRSNWYCLRGDFGSFRVHSKGASAVNHESGQGLFDRLRCFERLIPMLSSSERTIAMKARRQALQSMVTKFRRRVGSGKKVGAQGSGALKKFLLRHPLLVLQAVIRSYMSGK